MSEKQDYDDDAKSGAQDIGNEYLDEILEKFIDDDKVSDDLNNDYSGGRLVLPRDVCRQGIRPIRSCRGVGPT